MKRRIGDVQPGVLHAVEKRLDLLRSIGHCILCDVTDEVKGVRSRQIAPQLPGNRGPREKERGAIVWCSNRSIVTYRIVGAAFSLAQLDTPSIL